MTVSATASKAAQMFRMAPRESIWRSRGGGREPRARRRRSWAQRGQREAREDCAAAAWCVEARGTAPSSELASGGREPTVCPKSELQAGTVGPLIGNTVWCAENALGPSVPLTGCIKGQPFCLFVFRESYQGATGSSLLQIASKKKVSRNIITIHC